MENSPKRGHNPAAVARDLIASRLQPGTPFVVALSGGMDSVALLDALIPLSGEWRLAACHVHHGMSARADSWESFCRELCAERGVRLFVRRVGSESDSDGGGEMTEEDARRVRMRAFAGLPAAAIVAAHHADDQAETVLFRILRGTGAHGMGAMRVCAPLPGAGRMLLLRPWLEIPRAAVAEYARRRRLRWAEDEDNRNVARRRNFLRHRVMPVLREYFPDSNATLAAAASRFGAASALLAELADEDGRRAAGGLDNSENSHNNAESWEVAYFRNAGAPRLQNWLHVHLSRAGVRFRERGLAEAARQILGAGAEDELALPFSDLTFRVWRGRLYVDNLPPPPSAFRRRVDLRRTRLELPQIGGALVLRRVSGGADGGLCGRKTGGKLVALLRRGGERMQTAGRARAVSDLLREAEIAPWLRQRLPLLFAGDKLAAIPGVAVASDFRAARGETGVSCRMEWRKPPLSAA